MKGESVSEKLRVLLVGNNPLELSRIFENLCEVSGKNIVTEIAFDLATVLQRLGNFKPNFILIDDNIGRTELKSTALKLSNSWKTRGVPIAVLKNSNYQEALGYGIMNHVLKQNLNPDSVYRAFKNSLRAMRVDSLLLGPSRIKRILRSLQSG